jgi:hypothetical protein
MNKPFASAKRFFKTLFSFQENRAEIVVLDSPEQTLALFFETLFPQQKSGGEGGPPRDKNGYAFARPLSEVEFFIWRGPEMILDNSGTEHGEAEVVFALRKGTRARLRKVRRVLNGIKDAAVLYETLCTHRLDDLLTNVLVPHQDVSGVLPACQEWVKQEDGTWRQAQRSYFFDGRLSPGPVHAASGHCGEQGVWFTAQNKPMAVAWVDAQGKKIMDMDAYLRFDFATILKSYLDFSFGTGAAVPKELADICVEYFPSTDRLGRILEKGPTNRLQDVLHADKRAQVLEHFAWMKTMYQKAYAVMTPSVLPSPPSSDPQAPGAVRFSIELPEPLETPGFTTSLNHRLVF